MRRQGRRGDKESLATLVAETVSSSTTTNKISTQGPSGITFEATIVSQGGDAEWCSFDLNKQVSSAGRKRRGPAYLYLNKNNSDDDRTARIDVTYTNGYSTSLTLTQRAAGFIDYDRSWGEQPEYRSDDAYIYKTYYATFVSNQFISGRKTAQLFGMLRCRPAYFALGGLSDLQEGLRNARFEPGQRFQLRSQ